MHFIKMAMEAAFLYRSLRFVIGDKLVEYEVYEGLVPIVFFFSHEHVTGRYRILVVCR
jgi:hypothetical protein